MLTRRQPGADHPGCSLPPLGYRKADPGGDVRGESRLGRRLGAPLAVVAFTVAAAALSAVLPAAVRRTGEFGAAGRRGDRGARLAAVVLTQQVHAASDGGEHHRAGHHGGADAQPATARRIR
ncbi:hypothetical protein ADK88_27230 [Streptomyces sp. NRRL F-2295]|nr:hypothetical protein ADK88_27230 [Streptomyces sp. NRRL F-2295]